MILRRLRLIHKNQRGFTLIEVAIAFLITGIITSGITMTTFQVLDGNTRSSNHMIAVRQVQNAGYWVSHDTQMAQSVVITADPDGLPLTLIWTEWDGDEHQVVYTLLASNKLQRSHSVNGGAPVVTIVAEHIDPDPANTNCQFASGELTLTVTATVGAGSQQQSETRTYEVAPRPSG